PKNADNHEPKGVFAEYARSICTAGRDGKKLEQTQNEILADIGKQNTVSGFIGSMLVGAAKYSKAKKEFEDGDGKKGQKVQEKGGGGGGRDGAEAELKSGGKSNKECKKKREKQVKAA